MKKVIFKNVLIALFLTLGFLFSGAVETSAQVTSASTGTGQLPVGTFVGPDEAKTRIKAKLMPMKVTLGTVTGQTAAVLHTEIDYYAHIYMGLVAGKDVPNAIAEGLVAARSNLHGYKPTSQQLAALQAEAVDLLN